MGTLRYSFADHCDLPSKFNTKKNNGVSFQLPFHIDVIKCPKEIQGKSTAVHAAILAKDHVTIYDYPVIPKYDAQDVGK